MSKKLLIFPPILIGIAVLVALVISRQPPQQKPPNEQSRHVRIIKAFETDFVPRTIGFGNVQPGNVWSAVAQVSGQVEYVHPQFKKGAVFTAGTEIVRISPNDYEIAIRQAEANIRSAEIKLKELEVTEQNNKAALDIEEKSLAIKKQELERKVKLLQRGAVAQSTIDQERRDLLTQEKRVVDLQSSIRLSPVQKKAQQEQIAINKADLETAKLNLQRTKITLPFNARISEANVEVTQYVGVGTTIGTADSTKVAEVEAQFPLRLLSQMFRVARSSTAPVVVTPGTFQRLAKGIGLYGIIRMKSGLDNIEWRAEVPRISDTVDPKTRSIGIILTVDDHYKKVLPGKRPPLLKGLFVEAELRTDPIKNQIVMPRAALHNDTVYIVNKDNRLEIRPVKVALVQGNLAVIASGIAPGDNIVVSNLSPAIPNMLLRTTEDTSLYDSLRAQAALSAEENVQ
ncbi:MAG: efflux RND transporter periplasmic adaptor subunit [Pseudomonadota bacterium]